MLEPIIVDHPSQFPTNCVGCTSQTGPMLDTHREIDGYGRIYLCSRCAKNHARILGFTDGKRLDELEAAADSLVEKNLQLASYVEQVFELKYEHEEDARHKREQREENEMLIARVLQLESRIRERNEAARADMELVGAEE